MRSGTLKYAATVIVAAVFVCLALIGCADDCKIEFSLQSIELFVGESRDLYPYLTFDPRVPNDRTVTFETDSASVQVQGGVVTAVAPGHAVITATHATTNRATIEVTVGYRSINMLSVAVDGKLCQSIAQGEAPSVTTFTAVADAYTDPQAEMTYYVNGKKAHDGAVFAFTPDSYGEYTVELRHGNDLSCTRTVSVYRRTDANVEYVGALEQTDDFSAVEFFVREIIDPRNPKSRYVWRVNGEVISESKRFSFTPERTGEYTVTAEINGVAAAQEYKVIARGKRAPIGKINIVSSEKVRILWSDGEYIDRVTIVDPNGARRDFLRSDARYSYRFERGGFDASELISACSDAEGEYRITLAADGVSELTFRSYPAAVAAYTDTTLMYENKFIECDSDAKNLLCELYALGRNRDEWYVSRDANVQSAADAIRAEASRLRIGVDVTANENTLEISLYDAVNAPTRHETSECVRMYAALPHIEYDRAKRRGSSYVLAYKRRAIGVNAENSEQLLYAVMRGLRPLPKAGSVAEHICANADNILLSIIGAEYTPRIKIHAIYDWLQFVSYHATNADKTFDGGFLEGVFGSPTIIGGAARRSIVTSEGAAKAFALLACMEGIPCTIETDGGHMWNKVNIDGLWYNVDVFGGEIRSDELGIARASELLSHRALLVSDAQMRLMGYTPRGGEYEAYDDGEMPYLEKHVTDETFFDYYIAKSEMSDYASVKAAVFAAFSACVRGSSSVPVVGGVELLAVTHYGAEFAIDPTASDSDISSIADMLRRAADDYRLSVVGKKFDANRVVIYRSGNIIQIVATEIGS